jgi:hypothetical protein
MEKLMRQMSTDTRRGTATLQLADELDRLGTLLLNVAEEMPAEAHAGHVAAALLRARDRFDGGGVERALTAVEAERRTLVAFAGRHHFGDQCATCAVLRMIGDALNVPAPNKYGGQSL